MSKIQLQQALLAKLRADHSAQITAAHLARDEAVSEESRAENKYDTRGQEAAYLAEGQARLAAELEAAYAQLAGAHFPSFPAGSAIGVGALVSVSSPGATDVSWFFLSPTAGGTELVHEGKSILVLTPSSPLARELLGKKMGEVILWRVGARTTELEISSLS